MVADHGFATTTPPLPKTTTSGITKSAERKRKRPPYCSWVYIPPLPAGRHFVPSRSWGAFTELIVCAFTLIVYKPVAYGKLFIVTKLFSLNLEFNISSMKGLNPHLPYPQYAIDTNVYLHAVVLGTAVTFENLSHMGELKTIVHLKVVRFTT